jgi:outer membrane protein W
MLATLRNFFFVFFLISIFSGLSNAQFLGGSSLLGIHIGVSNVARATVLGVKFEEGITQAGSGTIGGSAKLDYYSWSTLGINQTFFFITVSAQYHLKIEDSPGFDPFAGIGFGYLYETNKYPGSSGITYYDNVGSGFNFVLSIGARYFLSPSIALRLEFATSPVYAVGGFDFGF